MTRQGYRTSKVNASTYFFQARYESDLGVAFPASPIDYRTWPASRPRVGTRRGWKNCETGNLKGCGLMVPSRMADARSIFARPPPEKSATPPHRVLAWPPPLRHCRHATRREFRIIRNEAGVAVNGSSNVWRRCGKTAGGGAGEANWAGCPGGNRAGAGEG